MELRLEGEDALVEGALAVVGHGALLVQTRLELLVEALGLGELHLGAEEGVEVPAGGWKGKKKAWGRRSVSKKKRADRCLCLAASFQTKKWARTTCMDRQTHTHPFSEWRTPDAVAMGR